MPPPLGALARYARRGAQAPLRMGEACEICSAPVSERHAHVVDLERRTLRCACETCARLFVHPGAAGGRYRTVPDRVVYDPALRLTDADWAPLGIPVRLAFFFYATPERRWVALYPSPAGATQAEIPREPWEALAGRTALIRCVEPDVEALLVHGERGAAELECLVVPVAACYELAARLRLHWKGFDGGDVVRRDIEAALEALRARRRPLPARRGGPS